MRIILSGATIVAIMAAIPAFAADLPMKAPPMMAAADRMKEAADRGGLLLFWQEPQDHPRNRKERKEHGAAKKPGPSGASRLCRVVGSEVPGQERHGENGEGDENDPGEHGDSHRCLSLSI